MLFSELHVPKSSYLSTHHSSTLFVGASVPSTAFFIVLFPVLTFQTQLELHYTCFTRDSNVSNTAPNCFHQWRYGV